FSPDQTRSMADQFDETAEKYTSFCRIHITVLQRAVSIVFSLLTVFLTIDGCYHHNQWSSLNSFSFFIIFQLSLIMIIVMADCGENKAACRIWISAMSVELLWFLAASLGEFPRFVIEELRWLSLRVEKNF
ncbi:hypothetical protein PFISCL1PPCAC_5360, partial [Pristionchus fissidentatus]